MTLIIQLTLAFCVLRWAYFIVYLDEMQPLFVFMKTNENKSYENSKLNSKAKNLQLENNTM